jgi:hypothetical protein
VLGSERTMQIVQALSYSTCVLMDINTRTDMKMAGAATYLSENSQAEDRPNAFMQSSKPAPVYCDGMEGHVWVVRPGSCHIFGV